MSSLQLFLSNSRRIIVFCLLILTGCDIPDRPPLSPEDLDPPAASLSRGGAREATTEILESPGTRFEGGWETWDAYFVKGRHVGYAHVKAEQISGAISGDVHHKLESRLLVQQGPLSLVQRVTQSSTETYDGRLQDFEGTVSVGPATTNYVGTVTDEKLRVETIRGRVRTANEIPWNPTYRGLVALEQSLRQRPMTSKGEERTLKLLLPGRYELATARMKCLGTAAVPLLDGESRQLTEIYCEIESEDGYSTFSTIWTESDGEIVRTHSPSLELVAYRTDQETATSFSEVDEPIAFIPVKGVLREPQQSSLVGYKIQPTAAATRSNVDVEVGPAPGQFVRRTDSNSIQVVVTRMREGVGNGFVGSDLLPGDGDSATNWYIDFNHERVRQFAALAIKNSEATQRDVAIELTRAVHQNVTDPNNMPGFTRASRVAEYWLADRTGQAVFLTALLRSRAIPARLALGLKYLPGSPARLEYHAWTLAYVDEAWLHLDPSEGGIAAADRLILSTTDLSSGNEFDALIPLLETMRFVDVEIAGHR